MFNHWDDKVSATTTEANKMNNQISRDDYGYMIETYGVIESVDKDDAGYKEFFEGVIEEEQFWVDTMINMVVEADHYESAEQIHDRIIDQSDWWGQGFTQQEVYGVTAATEAISVAVWAACVKSGIV